MGSLPPKAVTGQNFKKWVIDTLNKLIDYLHGARIKPGYGIMVRETPSGTIVELAKKQVAPVNNATGGGTGVTQDISASVSGGTASVTLSGATSAVEFVGTGDITISGNTDGQIEINATGGTGTSVGFPNYGYALVSVGSMAYYTTYGPYAQNAYLIGEVYSIIDTEERGNLSVYLSGGTIADTVHLFDIFRQNPSASDIIGVPVFLMIPAGLSFELRATTDEADINKLGVYPAL